MKRWINEFEGMHMKVLISKDPRYPIDNKKIRKKVDMIFRRLETPSNCELSIFFVGRRKAKQMNQGYRQMDYIPEVLSFSQGGDRVGGRILLGDLLICFPQVRERAIRENQLVDKILGETLEHGIKNLLKEVEIDH